MNKSTVFDCTLIQLSRIQNPTGSITAVNNNVEVPFAVQGVYYLYDVPGGEARGGHAHKDLQQLIIAASGSFDITVDDGNVKRTFHLSRPYMGLYMPSGLWRELDNFSSGSVCLVLASLPYDEADYIRSYTKFTAFKNVDFVEFDKLFLQKSLSWLHDDEIKFLTMAQELSEVDQVGFWNALQHRDDYKIWGITYDNHPIGACGLKNIQGSSAEYWGYIGEKEFWGKGLGKGMIDFVIKEASEIGVETLTLKVINQNHRAVKCYESYGFKLTIDDEVKTYSYSIKK